MRLITLYLVIEVLEDRSSLMMTTTLIDLLIISLIQESMITIELIIVVVKIMIQGNNSINMEQHEMDYHYL